MNRETTKIAPEEITDTTWMITFGVDQYPPFDNAAVLITGVDNEGEARQIMFALYGRAWSGIYDADETRAYLSRYAVTVIRRVVVSEEQP